MKRIISMLLCLVMLLSFVAVPVGAEDVAPSIIPGVEVTGTYPTVTPGEVIPEVDYAVSPDAPYVIESVDWREYNGTDWKTLAVGDPISSGCKYEMSIWIAPKEGYAFDIYNCPMTVNGSSGGFIPGGTDTKRTVSYVWSFLPAVETFEISFPEPVFGEAPGEVTIPGDSGYRVGNVSWTNAFSGGEVTTFEDDNNYQLLVQLFVDEGYRIPPLPVVVVNGVKYYDFVVGNYGDSVDIFVNFNYSKTRIYDTVITYAAPVVGAAIEQPVCATEGVAISSAVWTDAATGETVSGTFEAGKKYRLDLTLKAAEGYKFEQGYGVYVNGDYIICSTDGTTINMIYEYEVEYRRIYTMEMRFTMPSVGADMSQLTAEPLYDSNYTVSVVAYKQGSTEPYTGIAQDGEIYDLVFTATPNPGYVFQGDIFWLVKENYGYSNVTATPVEGTQALTFTKVCDLRPDLGTVTVTGVPQVSLGQQLPELNIQLSEGVKLLDAHWVDTYCSQRLDGNYKGVTQEGHVYWLEMYVTGDHPTKKLSDETVFQYTNGSAIGYEEKPGVWTVTIPYSFLKTIPEIDLQNVNTTLTVGESRPFPMVDPGEGFMMHNQQWFVIDSVTQEYVPAQGVVEAGKIYALIVDVGLEFGAGSEYGFTNDTVVKTNGTVGGYTNKYASMNSLTVEYIVPVGTQVIDRVDLTVTAPTIGGAIDIKNITVSADANYSVIDAVWFVSPDGTWNSYTNAGKTFEENGFYGFGVALGAKGGYHFGDSVAVYVNGQPVAATSMNGSQITYTIAYHMFDKLTAPVAPPAEDPTDPTEPSKPAEPVAPPVANVTTEDMDKAIAESKDGNVTVHAGGTTGAQLPVASLTDVAEADATLTVTMADATVTIDQATLEAVAQQAGGATVTLEVKSIPETQLNAAQQKAVEKQDVEMTISASFLSAGAAISDFKGGSVTVSVPFALETGTTAADYKVLYIADDGSVEEIASSYANGCLVFTLNHFSEYVVVNTSEKQSTDATEPSAPAPEAPKTGDRMNLVLPVLILSGAMLLALIPAKKYFF